MTGWAGPPASPWEHDNSNNIHAEGGVDFPKGKKPEGLIKRALELATNPGDWVLDPFSGVGSALLAALRHNRKAIGCEKEAEYVEIARQRIADLYSGVLPYRAMGKPVHQPTGREKVSQVPVEWLLTSES